MPLCYLILLLNLAPLIVSCTTISRPMDPARPPLPVPSDPQVATQHAQASSGIIPVEPDASNEPQEASGTGIETLAEAAQGAIQETEARESEGTDRQAQFLLDEALEFCQTSQDFWQKGELENALEALDRAYALILQVETADDSMLIQQKEDLRFMISKRILEIHASRNVAVNGHYNAIPLVLNHHVQAELDRFTKGSGKRTFLQAYQRSSRYRPHILQVLKEAGLPEELSWLPLIESSFKVRAFSRARALGLWQFIASTGYKYGLKRDRYVDERLDPIKSTHAAIAYLKELHDIFGDWATVLAAYNCGEGCVLHRIRKQNINYLDNFWDLYEQLPRETARYVPRFWATLHIVKNPEKYGLTKVEMAPPFAFETLEVDRQVHLKDIAKKTNIPFETLKALNPELRYHILPQETYSLRVPPGTGKALLAQLPEIPTTSLVQQHYAWHRVQRGETISTIAQHYRTTVRHIMRANNLRHSHYIVAGKKLRIPQKSTVIKQASGQIYLEGGIHVVKRGNSLWTLAKQYGTTTKKLQELNNLRSIRLQIGQRLKIPGHYAESSDHDNLTSYYVKEDNKS